MKRIFTIILLILSLFLLTSFSGGEKYRDFGTITFMENQYTGTVLKAYIDREYIDQMSQKSFGIVRKYRYNIMMESNSTYGGKEVRTLVFNIKILYTSPNGVTKDIVADNFPGGYDLAIEREETRIWWIETDDPSPNIKINFDRAIYEIPVTK